uniref:BPTI/Kunitz inhibitor domain-containing protein n=1 Tax=Oryzias latipes TaxID=8090 RepID=A0A3P9KJ14_ORYLA
AQFSGRTRPTTWIPRWTHLVPRGHDACRQPLDQGSCQTYAMMWFFDSNETKCAPFWYGGCGGNQNRFSTEEECQTVCLEGR